MVSSCSAYGCTYRHKKGDKIGIYRFPKDEYMRKLWSLAMRRKDWKPSFSSRVCGKHFLSGRPSRDKDHPDYVPSIFSFQNKKNTTKEQRKYIKKKASERLIKPVPFIHYVGRSESTKENDNVEEKQATAVSSNNKCFLLNKEIRPSAPQRVWLLNFIPAKNNPDMPVKIASVSSVNENHLSSPPNASEACESSGPFCVESSVTIDDDSRLSAYSDESTLTAKSSIPDEDVLSLDAEPSMAASKDSEVCNVESPVIASKDSIVCNAESSMVASKDSANCNIDTEEYTSESMTNDTLGDTPNSTVKSTKESSDCDYSNFMWSDVDTKEVLAIKLETMLAINMSLQQKVKFYQNRCKLYENEINNLKKLN